MTLICGRLSLLAVLAEKAGKFLRHADDGRPESRNKPDCQKDEEGEEKKKQQRGVQGKPESSDDGQILGEGGRPVGKGFGRGVDQYPGTGLDHVTGGRD